MDINKAEEIKSFKFRTENIENVHDTIYARLAIVVKTNQS
jgi:hypothetical protein